MSRHDDKYNDEEENLTQVRSIISQINKGKPSQNKKREVVVREDGTKVVRVTKKRRVLMTEREVRRRGRRSFVGFIAFMFLVLCALCGFFFFRMATMSGEAYVQSRVEDLKTVWGADSVRVVGSGISGTKFHLSSVVAEFSGDSPVKRIELSDVTSDLNTEAFLRGIICSRLLKVKRAHVVLRPDVKQLKMPMLGADPLWRFDRMECEDLSVSWGEGEETRLALRNTLAHLYYPRDGRDNCVIAASGGTMLIRNWQTLHVREFKVHLSPVSVEDLLIVASADADAASAEQVRSSITFRGRLSESAPLAGPYDMRALNMPFADFTKGRFEKFLTARTSPHSNLGLPSKVEFTEDGPVFSGDFHLERVIVTSFPAIEIMMEHIEPLKRRKYLPPAIETGSVVLSHGENDSISLEMQESRMMTRDLMALRGKITVNGANELSGTLAYGLPGLLTRGEYTDGVPDPLFTDKGEWTWLTTTLKGFANRPEDNSADLEAAAAEARKSRPERIQFDTLDINKLSDEYNKPEGTTAPNPGALESFGKDPLGTDEKSDDPFEQPSGQGDSPFAPTEPF